MSVRTFSRRFGDETGTTPLQWVLARRVARAQQLLEATDLTVESVAHRSGFADAPTLRRHFARHVGTTPRAYRAAFSLTRTSATRPGPVRPRPASQVRRLRPTG